MFKNIKRILGLLLHKLFKLKMYMIVKKKKFIEAPLLVKLKIWWIKLNVFIESDQFWKGFIILWIPLFIYLIWQYIKTFF